MTPERHRQIGELFHAIRRIPAAERNAFLQNACSNDESLRHEVESLLTFEAQASDFLKSSVAPGSEIRAAWISAQDSAIKSGRKSESSQDAIQQPSNAQLPGRQSQREIGLRSQLKNANSVLFSLVIGLVIVLMVMLGAMMWSSFISRDNGSAQSVQSAFPPHTTRSLSYSITVKRSGSAYSATSPFPWYADTILKSGDELQFHINAIESGFLYILNERPQPNGSVKYNTLFPEASGDVESARLPGNQTVQIPSSTRSPRDWFVVDAQTGVEKVWLIWSTNRITLLEGLKVWFNPQSRGEIGDVSQINALTEFLRASQANRSEIKRQDGQWTTLKSSADPLIGEVVMDHR